MTTESKKSHLKAVPPVASPAPAEAAPPAPAPAPDVTGREMQAEKVGAPPAEVEECYVCFMGTSWAKGETAVEAVKAAFGYEKPDHGRKVKMNVMRIVFPEAEENLNRVSVDGFGVVTFPAGSKITKHEGLTIPQRVVDAFSAFDLAFEDWTDGNADKAANALFYPD